MTLDDHKARFGGSEEAAPGWQAIEEHLVRVYGDQVPQHWGTVIKYSLGGDDPIDGVSVYRSQAGGVPHFHFCTYGFSALYDEEDRVGDDVSGYGFELTFRLRDTGQDIENLIWPINLQQNLARYVFSSHNVFADGHWIPANGPIESGADTDIVGLLFVTDPELGSIDTPHGRVDFLQMVGITSAEVEDLKARRRTARQIAAELAASNPLLITDLARSSR